MEVELHCTIGTKLGKDASIAIADRITQCSFNASSRTCSLVQLGNAQSLAIRKQSFIAAVAGAKWPVGVRKPQLPQFALELIMDAADTNTRFIHRSLCRLFAKQVDN